MVSPRPGPQPGGSGAKKNGIRNTTQASKNSTPPSSPNTSPLRQLEAMNPKAEKMNNIQPKICNFIATYNPHRPS